MERSLVLGFETVKLAPGEKRTLTVVPPTIFYGRRVLILRPSVPDPPWWKLKCALEAILSNVLLSLLVVFYRYKEGIWTWTPLYVRPPDERVVTGLDVGGVSQLVEGWGSELPASMFAPDALGLELKFDVAGPNKPIGIVVKNNSKRETDFACAIKGTC